MRPRLTFVALWFVALLIIQGQALTLRRNGPTDLRTNLLEKVKTTDTTSNPEECLTPAQVEEVLEEEIESGAVEEVVEAIEAIAAEDVVEAVTEAAEAQEEVQTEEVTEAIEEVVSTDEISEAVEESTGQELTTEQIIEAVEEYTGAETTEEALEAIADLEPEQIIEAVTEVAEEQAEEQQEVADAIEEVAPADELIDAVAEETGENLSTEELVEAVQEATNAETPEEVAEVIENLSTEELVDLVSEQVEADVEEQAEEQEQVEEAIEEIVDTQEVADAVAEETGQDVTTEDIIEAVQASTEAETVEEALEIIADLTPAEIVDVVSEAAEAETERECLTRQEVADVLEEQLESEEVTDVIDAVRDIAATEVVGAFEEAVVEERNQEIVEEEASQAAEQMAAEAGVSEEEVNEVVEAATGGAGIEDVIQAAETIATQEVVDAVTAAVREEAESGECLTQAEIVRAAEEAIEAGLQEEVIQSIENTSTEDVLEAVTEAAGEAAAEEELTEAVRDAGVADAVAEETGEHLTTPEIIAAVQEATGVETAAEAAALVEEMSEDELIEAVVGVTVEAEVHEEVGAAIEEVISTSEVAETVAQETGQQLSSEEIIQAVQEATGAATLEEAEEIASTLEPQDIIEIATEAAIEDRTEERAEREEIAGAIDEVVATEDVADAVEAATGEEVSTRDIIAAVQEATGAETAEEAVEIIEGLDADEIIEIVSEAAIEDREEEEVAIRETVQESSEQIILSVEDATGYDVTTQDVLQAISEAGVSSEEIETLSPQEIAQIVVDSYATEEPAAEEPAGEQSEEEPEVAGEPLPEPEPIAALPEEPEPTCSSRSANFTYEICGAHVKFNATDLSPSIVSYEWDFGECSVGDENAATGPQVEHTYGGPGSYEVTLIITDDTGATTKRRHIICLGPRPDVRPPPVSDFNCQVVGDTITCVSSSNGTISDYAWDFGEGAGTEETTGTTVTHTYTTAGTFNVTLTVTDDRGLTNTRVISVTPTVSDFEVEITGDTVTCTARSSGSITGYVWNFGDSESGSDNTASGNTATHTYTSPDTYTITLTITDEAGNTVSRTHNVTPTVADFSIQVTGDTVTCTARTSGSVASYAWNFGETGSESNEESGESATHRYIRAGTFTVLLTITDENGNTAFRSQSVTPTVAGFSFQVFGDTIDFDAARSSGTITSFAWNFGEGQGTGSGVTASHKFNAEGTFTVSLTVTDSEGHSATTSQTVETTIVLGDGNLQFTLVWDRPGDGDLHVRTPKQKVIYYGNTGPNANTDFGLLDIDDRSGRGPENIYWPSNSTPPVGTYHVCFSLFSFDPEPSEAAPVVGTISIRRPNAAPIILVRSLTAIDRSHDCNPASGSYIGSYTHGEGEAELTANFDCLVDGETINCDAITSSGNIHGYSWNFGEQGSEGNQAQGERASHTYSTAGSYNVTLTINGAAGESSIRTHTITPTVAGFTYEITGNTVTVETTSSGTIASYFWDFGEESSGEENTNSGNTASHTYTTAGTFTITLTVTDENGATSTRIATITPTVAEFEFAVSGNTVRCNATSSGDISTYSWDFGDATSADNTQTGGQVTHTYTIPGTYTITLTVTDAAGNTVTRTYEVTPTIAGYTFSVAGDTVTFDGTASSGSISSFAWNFGDEGNEDNEATGSSVSHTYTVAGTYTVILTITDETGATSIETREVTPTIASFTSTVEGNLVSGNAEGSSGTITEYAWNFGDEGSEGNTASGTTASHTYENPGSYTVELSVTDESGATNEQTLSVTPTVADFSFAISGNTVTVTSRSSGSISSHFWDFGDSTSGVQNVASGSSANHTYNTPGTFTVTLTVTDQDNNTNTRTHSVTPTVADFSFEINGNTVNFNAGTSSGTISSYAWTFGEESSGESNTATGATASHTYTTAGEATVTLTITDESGNTVTREHTLTPTVASFTLTLFGDTIDVDASGSSGTISGFAWNFGEENGEEPNTATGSTASHKYASTGSFTVTLTVTDDAGNTATSSRTAAPEVIVGLGNLGFTLIWDRRGDADLVVKTPRQKVIYYGNAGPNQNTDFGKLDVDDRSGTGPENIFWPDEHQPPRGTYHVCFLTFSFSPEPSVQNPVTASVSIRRPRGRAIHLTKQLTVTNRDTNCTPSSSNYVGSYTYGEGEIALSAQFTCSVTGGSVRCDAFSSEGNINGYSWNFGDEASGTSNVASGEIAQHTYAAAGTYTVSLTVRDESGATNTKTIEVVPTVSDFSFAVQGNTVTVNSRSSGTIASHYWDFGDSESGLANVATGTSASHTYTAAGTYTITLTVTDADGQTSIRRYTVTPTVAEFSFAVSGSTVNCNAGGSSGSIASYSWTFGDSAAGEGNTATGSQVSHTYTTPGSFQITLTVTDQAGATVTRTYSVTPTVAQFTISTSGSLVKVEASGSSGNIASYAWNFGETGRGAENSATGVLARHTYTTAGTFTITLTITDNTGAAVTRTQTVTPTVAAFDVQVRGSTVSVTSTGSGTVTAYNWNFGDQTASDNVATGQTASHTYATPGTYTITLGVTDASGVITATRSVTPTVAEFTFEVSGETVSVRSSCSGTISRYEWNFGESGSSSNTATGQTASHRYAAAGSFTITLTITDSAGGTSTRTRSVTPTVAAFLCQNNGAVISCNAQSSSGSISAYAWNFGDAASGAANVASGATASHTYNTVGTFTVTLTVTDSNRGTSSKTLSVTPTIAAFTATVSGETVNVDARTSGGQITRYAWNFGEEASGAANVATGATASHRYTTGGSFTITLTITDSNGGTVTKTTTVSPTVAALSCQLFGDTVDCTAQGTSGTITSYAWNFGEPASGAANAATGLTASHKYSTRGTFTITLTVTDSNRATSVKTTTASPTVILGTGNLQFTLIWDRQGDGDLLVGTPNGKTVYYANAGSNAGTDWAKLDVDDRTGTGPENIFWPDQYLPPDGNYHVCFNTYNFSPEPSAARPVEGTISIRRPDGSPITLRKRMTETTRTATCAPGQSNYVGSYNYIATNRVPLAANLVCTLFGDTVDCDAATSTGTISTYSWNFGDSSSSTNVVVGRTASHKYTRRAVYTITLTITSNTGATLTKTTTVEPTVFLGSGNLQFTLIWDRRGDADLVVKTPTGKVIYFGNSQSSPNTDYGKLDVDDTSGQGPENIFWPSEYQPPVGTYHVCFLTYSFNPDPSATPVTATATIRRPDGAPMTIRKTLNVINRDTNCLPSSTNYLGSYTYTR